MTEEGATDGVVVYCVTSRDDRGEPAAGPDLAGVGGGPVVVHEVGGVALWTEVVKQPVQATPEAILAHQAVVDRAWRTRTACLPLRYGQWFVSPGDAVAAVEERIDSLAGALDRVRDAVEYELRVEFQDPVGAPPAPAGGTPDSAGAGDRSRGRAYMETLRRRHARVREVGRRGQEVLDGLEQAVQDLVRERRPGADGDGCRVAHLLARSAEGRYVDRLRVARATAPGVHVRLKGPWPPWSFGA